VTGSCNGGNESSDSIKCGEFIDQLKTVSFSGRTVLHGESNEYKTNNEGNFFQKSV